jgi:hypothetical protein
MGTARTQKKKEMEMRRDGMKRPEPKEGTGLCKEERRRNKK